MVIPLNNSFSYKTRLANGVNALSKLILKIRFLSTKKPSKFCTFWTIQFGSNTYQIMYGKNLRLVVSAFAKVAPKSFNGKFAVNIDFPMGHFMLPLLTLTLEI